MQIVERGQIDTTNTHIHDHSRTWLCTLNKKCVCGGGGGGLTSFMGPN